MTQGHVSDLKLTKYVVEMNEPAGCVRCPMADDAKYYCHAEYEARHACAIDSKGMFTESRPDWCPLVPVVEYIISEFIDNANSQPEKDEEKQVVRLELYESEWSKAGALSLKYRLTMAQTIAKLVEEAYERDLPLTQGHVSDLKSTRDKEEGRQLGLRNTTGVACASVDTSIPTISRSFNGRTPDSGSGNRGSSPRREANQWLYLASHRIGPRKGPFSYRPAVARNTATHAKRAAVNTRTTGDAGEGGHPWPTQRLRELRATPRLPSRGRARPRVDPRSRFRP